MSEVVSKVEEASQEELAADPIKQESPHDLTQNTIEYSNDEAPHTQPTQVDEDDQQMQGGNDVLLGSIEEDEAGLNEFATEEANESQQQRPHAVNKNNINLHDVECHDDSLLVGVPADETGLYDDVMAAPSLNLSSNEFNNDLVAPNSNTSQDEAHNANAKTNTESGSSSGQPRPGKSDFLTQGTNVKLNIRFYQ